MGEWIGYKRGGVYCSECGYFCAESVFSVPARCPSCNEMNTYSKERVIDGGFRLTKNAKYLPESEYPEWLIKKMICNRLLTLLLSYGLPSNCKIECLGDVVSLSEFLYDHGLRPQHKYLRVRKVKKRKELKEWDEARRRGSTISKRQ